MHGQPPASPRLRDRQLGLTRRLILEALAELIAEDKVASFSMQDVADRAGTSLRTIYRHFASREALLEGLVRWGDQLMADRGGMEIPTTVDEIPSNVEAKFAALEEFAPMVVAAVDLGVAAQIASGQSSRWMAAMRPAFAEVTSHLEPGLAEAVLMMIRQICSVNTWKLLHEEGHIDAARAGATAAWTVEVLLAALRDGDGPTLEDA